MGFLALSAGRNANQVCDVQVVVLYQVSNPVHLSVLTAKSEDYTCATTPSKQSEGNLQLLPLCSMQMVPLNMFYNAIPVFLSVSLPII